MGDELSNAPGLSSVFHDSTLSGNGTSINPLSVVGGTGGSGTANIVSVTQTTHGFSVGQVLKISGTSTYALAQADSVADAEFVGMVLTVPTANTFTMIISGYTGASTLTGVLDTSGNPLVADTVYFIDPTTAGGITSTKPTANGQVIKPILNTDTTSSGYINNFLGDLISTASTAISLTGDVTGTGTTSIATTIANNAVTYAKFQQVAANSLVGNPTGSLANASGITLGAGLAFSGTTLTNSAATTNSDGTITVTGTAPSAVVSLNLGNANIWTAKQNIQLTTTQLQLGYDSSHYMTATVGSTGAVTLALTGTSPTFTFSQQVIGSGGLYTTGGYLGSGNVNHNSNFASTSGGYYVSDTTSALLFGGASTVQFRNVARGNSGSNTVLTAGVSAANTIFGAQPVTAGTSGTHGLLANIVFLANAGGNVITGGAANITNLANVYIDGAPTVSGGTGTVGTSYAVWVGGGNSRFDGPIILPVYTVSTLPTGIVGMRAYVSDATSPTFLGTLTGSGTVKTPVFYNGTAWVSC